MNESVSAPGTMDIPSTDIDSAAGAKSDSVSTGADNPVTMSAPFTADSPSSGSAAISSPISTITPGVFDNLFRSPDDQAVLPQSDTTITPVLHDVEPYSDKNQWPTWLLTAVTYLEEVSNSSKWTSLTSKFIALERSLNFSTTMVSTIDYGLN